MFPAIKTALVDVCHRKKVWHRISVKVTKVGTLGTGLVTKGIFGKLRCLRV